ncbi:Double-strand break repair protein MRE11 [Vanrija pseudolonga]|uniref:Double-strand break repair protein n=1 Tax=Vanrija pseudolonga TaxID=143232 RepID=A0AAF1BG97_9TREE|nr:Double-strand break repair protein MRE11 [Vanrija pseudolonga]
MTTFPGLLSDADTTVNSCFRILLATDNHIGYAEKDPIRGQDAINTFREILQLAVEEQVDFILLAGDLFHENKPSRTCMHQTIALLRQYTLGDKPISFELLSDPMDGSTPGFSFPAVNYEDPNLNIAIPVFSIHGNHDDPQGTGPEGALCALDVLSVSGVLNYFGKVDLSADEANEPEDKGIKIRPILLRKGDTHLALYGVGNVKDQRMHYELRSNRVKMYMPEGGEIAEDDWFNILLVHQNRVKHGPQQFVPEGMFDDSIKLVVWGHEHDCRITPESVEGKEYFITQPGSSVATSLAPGEALQKHVGILSVQGSQFQIASYPLKTVRPFELDEVVLAEEAAKPDSKINLDEKDTISAFLRGRVEDLIRTARRKWNETHDASQEEMMLPLIRLKVREADTPLGPVETSEAKEMTNPVRFGQDFIGRVANPRDVLQYYRKKKTEKKAANRPDVPEGDEGFSDGDDDDDGMAAMTTSDRLAKVRMANLVRQYLKAQSLDVLIEDGLEDAVMRFVDKDDKDAIKDFVSGTLEGVGKEMRSRDVEEENVEEEMANAKDTVASHFAEQPARQDKSKKAKGKGRNRASDNDSMAEDSMMEEDSDDQVRVPARNGATRPRAAAKSKGQPALFTPASDDDNDEDEQYMSDEPPSPPPKAAAKSRAAKAKAAPKTPSGTAKKAATSARSTKTSGAASRPQRQTQLSFTKKAQGARGSRLVESDSD